MKLCQLTQKTKAWIDFRRLHVCASDAPAILGMSPYKKISDIYKEKTQGFEQITNPYMQRGLDLESIALEKFEKETGLIFFPAVAIHENNDWMAASFDGVTICREAILEIKCPGKKDHGEALKGRLPKHYYPQVQHQIEVSGLDMSFYFSFDGENGVIIEVKRDQEFIDIMLAKEFEFWQSIQNFAMN